MNKLFRFICTMLLIVNPLIGEAVNYPTTQDDYTSLYQAVNNIDTNLDGDLDASATSVTVDNTSGFPTSGHFQVDNEIIYYGSKVANQFRSCIRGSDGTSATTHSNNASVKFSVIAAHHNILVTTLTTIEGELGLLPKGSSASVRARLDAIDTVLSTTLTQNQTITLAGDASGTGNTTITVAVGDDSHNHTASTISGLGVGDFTSSAVSQFFNDSGFITGNQTITITGDGSGTGTTSIDLTVSIDHTKIGDFDSAVTSLLTDSNIPDDITISTDKSITASAFYGDGSNLTGIAGSVSSVVAGQNLSVSSTVGDVTVSIDGTIPFANGGLGFNTTATGDIIYANAENSITKLAKGNDNKVLKLVSGIPSWQDDLTSAGAGIATIKIDGVTITGGASILDFQDNFTGTETPSGTVEIAITGITSGVSSVNSLTGGLTLAAGTGITVTSLGSTITVSGSSAGTLGGAKIYNNADITITSNTNVYLPFNSEYYDSASYHDVSTTNSKFEITDTGYYHIGFRVAWYYYSGGYNSIRTLYIMQNRATVLCKDLQIHVGNEYYTQDAEVVAYLSAGDDIEFVAYQYCATSGQNIAVKYYATYSPMAYIERIR